MPASFDVDDAFDTDFFDEFTLVRRLETVDQNGFSNTTQTVTPCQLAVITASSPNDLQRWPEADVSLKSITITTKIRLQLASPGAAGPPRTTYKADIILWAGNSYQIGLVEDYSRYGEGYLWCLAQAIEYTPAAPTPNPLDDA